MIDTRAVMRSLPLVASVLGRKYGVQVEMGGMDAYTDGKTIHLPALPSEVPDTLLAMARGYLDHEAAHVRETDFSALEQARLTPLEMHVWNTLEDWRVEHKLAAIFPGCRQNFDWLIGHIFGSDDRGEPAAPAMNIFNWLLLEVRSWDVQVLSRHRDTLAGQVDMDFQGMRPKIKQVLKLVRTRCDSTHAAIDFAREIVRVLDHFANHTDKPQAPDQNGPEAQNAPSSPFESGEAKSEEVRSNDENPSEIGEDSSQHTDQENESVLSYSPPSDHAHILMGAADPDADYQARDELKKLLDAGEDELPQNLGSILASVLNDTSQTSSYSGISVAVQTSKHAVPLSADDVLEVRQASMALRTRLSGLLQTKILSRASNGRRGRLDTGHLHRLAVSDPRVFRTKSERVGIDTAVHILLDCSGSMVRRIHLACQACYAVASALEASRINVAVTAFPGAQLPNGSYTTVSPIIRHGQRVHTTLDLGPAGGTPMGEALWWVMQDMLPLTEKRKLILVITDGDPDSADCANQAIKQGLRAGFEIYGVGITSSAIMSLLPERSVVVNTVTDLAPAMFSLLQHGIFNDHQG
ncbi:Cobalamin biosynthesis protein CobT [Desulfomicrobium apsheronum]|uniref:Cobalamin biosynthesis protein CobT n=1 Tax=Desulfomicrobium apsheronum TaxID=52560 RepID=A0A1I3PII2_9BACT|nr:VWA domain-containing protein [Desulfomicrobium apsheronum]SFJ21302.1 Cobalamin biosynthesis protein CobT [Desulfomicrobium apsheronum]